MALTKRTRFRGMAAAFVLVLLASCSVAVDSPSASQFDSAQGTAPGSTAPSAARTEPTALPSDPDALRDQNGLDDPDTASSFTVDEAWPEVVREYVQFVQDTRGEEFDSIPDIRFAGQAQLQAEFALDIPNPSTLPAETQRVISRIDDIYRALGLSNQDFDIYNADQTVYSDIAAFYDWQVGEIVFPSPGGETPTDISIIDRPVLVHELGHALQTGRRLEWSQNLDNPALGTALIEGEAEWLLDRYIDELSDAEYFEWYQALPDRPVLDNPPPEILSVEFAVPYVLGGRFFHARYASGGLDEINETFFGNKVTARMLIDPWSYTGNNEFAESLDYVLPAAATSGEYLDIAFDFPMSAVNWHQVLGAAMPAQQALTAARNIVSFTLPTGWVNSDDQACFAAIVVVAEGQEETVRDAFDTWRQIEGVERFAKPNPDGLYIGGCDPGAGNVPDAVSSPDQVLQDVALVIDAETWAVTQGLDNTVGFCLGWRYRDAYAADEELDAFAWFQALDQPSLPSTC